MSIRCTQQGRTLRAQVWGELDHHRARETMQTLELAVAQARPTALLLDLSGLTFTDSSGIADRILLPALPASLGLSSDTAGISGTAYTVAVSHPDYHCPEHQQVLVFPRIESVLAVTLPPQREEG